MAAIRWHAEASIDVPGWLGLPPIGEEAGWVDERLGGLRTAAGDRWTAELERTAPILLQSGLDRRDPDDMLAWQVWPGPMPFVAIARLRVADSAGPPAWEGEDVRSEPIDSPTLGRGTRLMATARLDGAGEGERASFLAYLWDDGGTTVALSVDPTLTQLAMLTVPGLESLAERTSIVRDDGTRFWVAAPTDEAAAEVWALEDAP